VLFPLISLQFVTDFESRFIGNDGSVTFSISAGAANPSSNNANDKNNGHEAMELS
jgi:hypothetical protein